MAVEGTYIDIPFEDDPEELADDAFELLQAQYPDWLPNDGNLDTWMIEAMARIASEVQRIAVQVPKEIFKFAGQDLFRVEPRIAVSATAGTTWHTVDDRGYTIPEGTLVGIRTSGDTLVPFQTVVETVVTTGQTFNDNISIIAVEEGVDASGIGTPGQTLELIDLLDFVSSITLNGPTTGGEDEESVADYLDRLREVLRYLTPRPVLAIDYAPIARTQPGIDRAVAIDNWIPGTNEKQTIDITPDPTGGTFTLTWSGQTTAAIAWNASAATVQAALEALSNITPGDIRCTGGPLPAGTITLEWVGPKAEADQAAPTGSGTNLTGAGGPFNVVVATPTAGTAPQTSADRAVTVAVATETGEPVNAADRTALDAYLQSLREQNFIISVIDPNYTIIDVTATVKCLPDPVRFVPADVKARVEEVIRDFLSPGNWGKADLPLGARSSESAVWHNELIVRYLEVAAAINSVEGVDYITTTGGNFDLTIGVGGSTQARADILIVGTVPLPRPGTILVTAT
jgi:hypothetical protein